MALDDLSDTLSELSVWPTAYISDALARIGQDLRWMSGLVARSKIPRGSYVGKVLTVQWGEVPEEGENLTLYDVIRHRKDETILLIAGSGQNSYTLGDNVSSAAAQAGFRAVIVEGCIRDSGVLRGKNIGIFSQCVHGQHPTGSVVSLGIPVMFGRTRVVPGEIVAVDNDGGLVFPSELASVVLEHTKIIADFEVTQREMILREAPLDELYSLLHDKHG